MKTLLLLGSLLVISQLNAQTAILEHNNSSALISNSGTVFQGANATPGYEVPKGSGNHAINGLQFWYSSKDSLGNIRVNKGGVPGIGTDVFAGAYSDSSDYTNANYMNHYGDGIWSICQWEIDQYVLWWECNAGLGNPGDCMNALAPNIYTMEKIQNWPAHGNVANGEHYWMAPFYDRDQDGSYDPNQGDVPIIKGCCATYMIQNDHSGQLTYSSSDGMGLEFHYMFYQYKTYGTYLDNATFVDLTIFNWGQDYEEFNYGLMVDGDLGFSDDDYFGSDSTTNMMYFYNADNDDDNNYGSNPPAIGIVALDTNITSCVMATQNSTPAEMWNLMNGQQINGTDYIHPDGYPTKFLFSDDPNDPTGYSQLAAGSSPGDQKGLMSTSHGAFDADIVNWTPANPIKQSYAIIYQDGGDNLQNVQNLIAQAAEVQLFYDNDSDIACEGTTWGIEEIDVNDFILYPNPSSGQFTIENGRELEIQISVIDLMGNSILEVQPSSVSSVDIQLPNASQGVYLVMISNGNGSVVKKVIIE